MSGDFRRLLKSIQWTLFLLIALGTAVGVLGFGFKNEAGILLLFLGLSASVYVFMFVPYSTKFYLSELLRIIFSLAAETTLILNTMRQKLIPPPMFALSIAAALLVPFITFILIDRRRPKGERLMDGSVPPLPPRPLTRQQARNGLIWNGVLFASACLPIVLFFCDERIDIHPIFALYVAVMVSSLFAAYSNWKAYKQNGGTNATVNDL